jgi:hypothetical protein
MTVSDTVRSEAGYTVVQLRYIDWLAASRYERRPITEQLLAGELGVTDRTLRRWKQLPGFREAITQRARELLGDDLPEIYGALRREAIKGSFPHIKMAMEMTGEYSDAGASDDKPLHVWLHKLNDQNEETK